jgi:hypothetical protein
MMDAANGPPARAATSSHRHEALDRRARMWHQRVRTMKAAMVVRCAGPVPGRELAALAYGREVDDFYGKRASEGLCTEPKWLWGPHGELLWIVEGEYEALLGILARPEAQNFMIKGSILLQGYGHDLYEVGREEMFGRYQETLKELKIA